MVVGCKSGDVHRTFHHNTAPSHFLEPNTQAAKTCLSSLLAIQQIASPGKLRASPSATASAKSNNSLPFYQEGFHFQLRALTHHDGRGKGREKGRVRHGF